MLNKSKLKEFWSCPAVRVGVAVVAALSLVGVRSAVAQNSTWTIKADISAGTNALALSVSVLPLPANGGCPTADLNLSVNGVLYGVCQKDKIIWQAVKGGTALSNDQVIIFSDSKIFNSQSGDTITGVGGASTYVAGTNQDNPIWYYIGVLDNSNWHTQDPKIMIGSGGGTGVPTYYCGLQRAVIQSKLSTKEEEKFRLELTELKKTLSGAQLLPPDFSCSE